MYIYRVAELSLHSEHLQQQLAESQTAGSRLSEDVNRLSLTLNHTQSRLRDMENEHHQSFIVSVHSEYNHKSPYAVYVFQP